MIADIGGAWRIKKDNENSYHRIRISVFRLKSFLDKNKKLKYIYLKKCKNNYKIKGSKQPDYLLYFDDFTNERK